MLNLIEAQEALKQAPDTRLIQEMQQPSGNLPAFLVLGEMQRRQKMRQEAQAQQQAQQQGSTVAQDLTQQTGLAALAQMQPQMMQPAMQQQMMPQQMPQQMQQRPAGLPAMMYSGGPVYMNEGGRVDPNDPSRTPFQAFIQGNRNTREDARMERARREEMDAILRDLRMRGTSGRSFFFTPQGERAEAASTLADVERNRSRLLQLPAEDFARFRQNPRALLDEIDPLPVPPIPPPIPPQQGDEIPPPPPPAPPIPTNRPAGDSTARTVTTASPAAASQDPPAQRQPAQPDRFEALLERMISSRGDPAARQAQQRDMSLLQLGLGLMGSRSPTLGGALGEAGMPALASYAAAQRNAEREDRQSLEDQVNLERYRTERDYRAEETRRREAADNRRLAIEERRLAIEGGRGDGDPFGRAVAGFRLVFGREYDPSKPEDRRDLLAMMGRGDRDTPRETPINQQIAALQPEIGRLTAATQYGPPRNATPEVARQYNENVARLRELQRINQDLLDRMVGLGGFSSQPRNPDRVVSGVQ